MKRKITYRFLFVLSIAIFHLTSGALRAQAPVSTDSLVHQFHDAWNAEDIGRMVSLLDPDAFFKSPFQLRYSRDTMEATVLITNPPIFKVVESTETYSNVHGNVAWSIGKMVCDWYNENGTKKEEQWYNDYVYMFVERQGEWKLQMLFFHE